MKPQFKRASLASQTCVQKSARVVGQTLLFAPPLVIFSCVTVAAWTTAPLLVDQAETALESAAWTAGRAWAAGVDLTHAFEGAPRHKRIGREAGASEGGAP